MDHLITITLSPEQLQSDRLRNLQTIFAEACNAIAEIALAHRCWNRVALHHMVYREMRERYPDLGAQMICNAVYSVCRTCRLIFQNPKSPFHSMLQAGEKLPNIRFAASAPVYFDRHTLSLRGDVLSLYTLEGRMKFRITLSEEQGTLFQSEKLKEICLTEHQGRYQLRFKLGQGEASAPGDPGDEGKLEFPEYLLIKENPMPVSQTRLSRADETVNASEGSAQ